MILAFDTETTGLPLFKDPSEDPRQPDLIQFAAILLDMDGNEVETISTIVRPRPDAIMAPEAFEAHGIRLERAMDEGCDPTELSERFFQLAREAKLFVGHNVSFDHRIMRIMIARYLGFKFAPIGTDFCTMKRSTAIVNLPPTERMRAASRFGPKPPNLGECIRYFFNEELEGAHDALNDVRASLRVYLHLTRQLGVVA